MHDYSIAVLENTIDILELLLDDGQPKTLAQLTAESGFSKNKVFRVLYTLEKHSYVERDETGAYRLGVRFLDFGFRVQHSMRLLDVSPPVMDWLTEETSESIFLGVVDGDEVLCVDARESSQRVRLSARVGRRLPIYAGGIPRVLLSNMDDEERSELLDRIDLLPATDKTIIEPAALAEAAAEVKRNGYAIAVGDLDEGAHSIAAPIYNHKGKVVAGISIAGPSRRFDEETAEHYIELILQGAERISQALGYRAYNQTTGPEPGLM